MAHDTDINETLDLLDTLITTLEAGNISMTEAKQLHEEGHQHIDEMRTRVRTSTS